ncbi:hypothetical protein ACLOJK_028485, partial [Asimina triloba]
MSKGARARDSVRPGLNHGAPSVLHHALEMAAAAATAGEHAAAACHHLSSPPRPCRPPSSPPPMNDERRRRRSRCYSRRTHHERAILAPIQTIHNDGNDEHITDPSRPQTDVDHRDHMRRALSGHPFFQKLAVFICRPSSATINHKPTVQPASHEHDNDPTSQHAATVAARARHCRCPLPAVRRHCLRRLIATVHSTAASSIQRQRSSDPSRRAATSTTTVTTA